MKTIQILFKSLLAIGLAVLWGCQSGEQQGVEETAPERKIVKVPALEALVNDESGKLQVVNFWATWCKPCVEELPAIEKARQKYADKGVNFTLITLDFASDFEPKVLPFVEKKGIGSNVWLIDNTDYNSWIDLIAPEWGGEIPVTLLVNKQQNIRHFVPKEVTYQTLDSLIAMSIQ